MTADALWKAFTLACKIPDGTEYEAWSFGEEADLLAELTLQGKKTATSSALPLYQLEEEPLPRAGEYSVVLDGEGQAVCVIQTTKVEILPFFAVGQEHAWQEGEGDRSLKFWRQVHQEVFTRWLAEAGLTFSPELPVVCEEFRVVYPEIKDTN